MGPKVTVIFFGNQNPHFVIESLNAEGFNLGLAKKNKKNYFKTLITWIS